MSRLVVPIICLLVSACAGAIYKPEVSPATRSRDALLVIPGFGYNRAAERVLRSLAPSLTAEGFDLYVPSYISRSGLIESRARLVQFMREQGLGRYDRLHVFAFIAGAWTLNPLAATQVVPNLATVVYDRSPLQERAPRIASEKLPFLTWLRYGSPVFDVAKTSYVPLDTPDVRVGLMVETTASSFIRKHAKTVRTYGAFRFECDAFDQRYDDCLYLRMNHDELYARFAEVWPELLTFIRTGRFSASADRLRPTVDPFEPPDR
jgi:hypothetical protein